MNNNSNQHTPPSSISPWRINAPKSVSSKQILQAMSLSAKQVEEALTSNNFLNSEIKSAEFEGMSSDGIFVYKCIFSDGMYGKRECKGIIKIRFKMRVNEDEYIIIGEY